MVLKKLFKNREQKTGKTQEGIPEDILQEYRAFAGISPDAPICKAPFISMRLNRSGGITPCCQNYQLSSLADGSLLEVWNSEAYKNLRRQILNHDLDGYCDFCKTHLLNRDYGNVLASSYDAFDITDQSYPSYLDFSIDNRCNLQCVMCNPGLSSSHANRDTYKSGHYYDEAFLADIEKIIPHLNYAIFSGGEPFLIDKYYRIWSKMMEINPQIDIVITTNATHIPDKARKLLEQGHFSFNVSIDTLDPSLYEQIRSGASFSKTIENLRYLIDYTRVKKSFLTIVACPLQINYQTLPDLAGFAEKEGINLYFNLVTKPHHLALWAMPARDLQKAAAFLKEKTLTLEINQTSKNQQQLQILIDQSLKWAQISHFFETQACGLPMSRQSFLEKINQEIQASGAYEALPNEEKEIFDQSWNEILNRLPDSFLTVFFLERILNIGSHKIINEVLHEGIETGADNLCSIYYYARGEAYWKLSQGGRNDTHVS